MTALNNTAVNEITLGPPLPPYVTATNRIWVEQLRETNAVCCSVPFPIYPLVCAMYILERTGSDKGRTHNTNNADTKTRTRHERKIYRIRAWSYSQPPLLPSCKFKFRARPGRMRMRKTAYLHRGVVSAARAGHMFVYERDATVSHVCYGKQNAWRILSRCSSHVLFVR